MSRARIVLAAVLAGGALLAPAAQAQQDECVYSRCYQCVMYPCGPGDWVEFATHRAVAACEQALAGCPL
ncbi:MAG TPA: hypothetical protein VF519_07125 [Mycobacteriales bacterium]|jgi:hypothetical protein